MCTYVAAAILLTEQQDPRVTASLLINIRYFSCHHDK